MTTRWLLWLFRNKYTIFCPWFSSWYRRQFCIYCTKCKHVISKYENKSSLIRSSCCSQSRPCQVLFWPLDLRSSSKLRAWHLIVPVLWRICECVYIFFIINLVAVEIAVGLNFDVGGTNEFYTWTLFEIGGLEEIYVTWKRMVLLFYCFSKSAASSDDTINYILYLLRAMAAEAVGTCGEINIVG